MILTEANIHCNRAYSIFWSRALNIPFPRSYVFPESLEDQRNNPVCQTSFCGASENEMAGEAFDDENVGRYRVVTSTDIYLFFPPFFVAEWFSMSVYEFKRICSYL